MLLRKYTQHAVKLFSWLNEGCAALFFRAFSKIIRHVRVWWGEGGPNIRSSDPNDPGFLKGSSHSSEVPYKLFKMSLLYLEI